MCHAQRCPGIPKASMGSVMSVTLAPLANNRPATLAAVAGRKRTPFHGAGGADALQGIGQQWPSGRGNDDRRPDEVATMIGGDLEGCGPSQPLPAVNGHPFTAPRERTPSAGRRRSSIRYPVAHLSDFFAPRGSGSHRADSIDNQTGTSTALGSWWHNTAEDPVGRSF
jgi:hypothetical protein